MNAENEINRQFRDQFMSTSRARALLKHGEVVTEEVFDNSSGRVWLRFEGRRTDGSILRTGFFEAYLTDEADKYKDRLVFSYPDFPYLGLQYKVTFSEDRKHKVLESEVKFYIVEGKIVPDRPKVLFSSNYRNGDLEHVFQATYYARNHQIYKKGELIYVAYSSPFHRISGSSDLNMGVEKRKSTGIEGKQFGIISNIPKYNLQFTDNGLYILEPDYQGDPEKVKMMCIGTLDLDMLENLIICEGDGWKTFEKVHWPISYLVRSSNRSGWAD